MPDEARQARHRVGLDHDLVMVGLEVSRHDARVLQLVVLAMLESDREGPQRAGAEPAGQGDDGAGVDAAAEQRAERHVADEP